MLVFLFTAYVFIGLFVAGYKANTGPAPNEFNFNILGDYLLAIGTDILTWPAHIKKIYNDKFK